MKKLLLFCLIFLFSCGPDCPPCPDKSKNLSISAKHWRIIECAGPEWPEYIRNYVHCAYHIDELIHEGKPKNGLAKCDCDNIYIKYSSLTYECSVIIHETAHIESYCDDDENYPYQKQREFYDDMSKNDCFLLTFKPSQ